MIRRPPRSTRTVTLLPDTTLVRARARSGGDAGQSRRHAEPAGRGRYAGAARRHAGAAQSGTRIRRRVQSHLPRTGGAARRCAVSRSEEHTSELQSLMRISYAVFCLKKKTTREQPRNYTTAKI